MVRDTGREGVETMAQLVCPYCGRAMRWTPMMRFRRGGFECENCGDFLDYRSASDGKTNLTGAPDFELRH